MNKKKRLYKFSVRFRAKENEQNKKKNNTKTEKLYTRAASTEKYRA